MTERPILFSAPMVLALLAGTKTQTRRIVKPQPFWLNLGDGQPNPMPVCPYGAKGDRLWVKESIRRIGEPKGAERWCSSEFIADGELTPADCWPWKNKALPSIHMPRGVARLTLEVVDVQIERLQEISEADAVAEGVTKGLGGNWTVYGDPKSCFYTAKHSYESLWESINGAGSWSANPWVWVVEFKVVKP